MHGKYLLCNLGLIFAQGVAEADIIMCVFRAAHLVYFAPINLDKKLAPADYLQGVLALSIQIVIFVIQLSNIVLLMRYHS